MRFALAHTCLLAALSVPVNVAPGAAPAWPVPRGPSHEPVPYQYDAKQWQRVPKRFLEDAPACTLHASTTHLVEGDGTIETITHEVTRLGSRKAIEKLGEYRNISYTPAYEKLTLNEARVLKADGRVVPVEARHVQLRDVATDFQVYDTSKQLVISFPTLEVGDCYEVKWTVRSKNPEHAGHFFNRYSFGDDRYPVVSDNLIIRMPKARLMKYGTTAGRLDPEVREEGNFRFYHWKTTNRPQLPPDDNLPSKEDLRLQVAYSTFASWDEVFQWKKQLRQDCWKCTDEVKKLVAEVTRDLKTPEEKARALTYWVRRHVRYVSTGEKHDYTPHTPVQVLENRFGDCKDTSQLLAVMLREAGVPVALVTLGTLDDGQVLEEVPSPWGTHAILLVTIDGKDHWIDTTASLAGWDFLPKDDRDRLAYVVDDKQLRLVRTPALTPEQNRIEQTTRMTIGADGSSRAERTSIYTGSAALARRHDWVEVPLGERRRLVSSELQDAQSSSRLVNLTLDEEQLKDYGAPVRANFVFEVPGQFGGDPDREGNFTDSPIWGKLLTYTLDYDRQVPMDLGSPFESVHTYSVRLPLAYRLDSLPRDRAINSKWGSFLLTVKADPKDERSFEVRYQTRIEKVRVEPADFDAFRKFHEEVSKSYRVWLTLRPTRDPADIPGLEALLALTPGDNQSAAVLASLYLQESKPEEARRVLRRARYFSPNEAALTELAVKAAADAKEEEALYRDLVKRYPEELKYSVALGRVLVNSGKYAAARVVLQPVVKHGGAGEKAQAHFQLARNCFAENRAKDALKHLESALEADEDSVRTVAALEFRGRVFEKLGKIKDATQAYRDALKVDPESKGALEALVQLALNANNNDEALASLRRYTVAVGNDGAGLARAADYHLRLDRPEDAFELATRSIKDGDHPLAHRTLGLILFRRGAGKQALPELEKAELDTPVLEARVRCHLALGQLDKALHEAERADKVAHPTPELVSACALTLRLAQRRKALAREVKIPPEKADAWDAALDAVVCAEQLHAEARPAAQVDTLLATAFADGVQLGEAHSLRGLLALDRGRLERALADAEKAVQLSPKGARGYYVRGRVRLERGDKEALADLTKAAELSERKNAAVLHWLATALAKAGRRAEALAAQREAVKLSPKDGELMEQLREFEKEGQQESAGP